MRIAINYTSRRRLLAALCALAGLALHSHAHAELRVLARTGDALPGSAGTLSNFQNPVLRRAGEPVLAATLTPPTGGSRRVLIRIGPTPGQGRVLVSQGDPSPDANGNFGTQFTPMTSSFGAVAFQHTLQNALSNSGAIFHGGVGNNPIAIAVREGDTLPGGGTVLLFDDWSAMSDSGVMVFGAALQPSFARGIWSWSVAGGAQRVILNGDANPAGGTIQLLGFAARLNELQSVAFVGLTGADWTLLRRSASTTVQIARGGILVPGGNGRYNRFGDFRLNDLNHLAWLSSFTQTSGGTADDQGILLHQGANASMLVRKGAFVPDGNGRYLDLANDQGIRFNNRNEVLFLSTITGASNGSDQGIFLHQPGGTLQLARRNQPAPGGGSFTRLEELIGLNHNGVALFSARTRLTPQDIERLGLFEYRNGAVRKIVAVGDTVPGFGLIKGLSYAVDTGPGATPLNERDQFAFVFSVNSTQHLALWDPTPPPPDAILRSGFEAPTP